MARNIVGRWRLIYGRGKPSAADSLAGSSLHYLKQLLETVFFGRTIPRRFRRLYW